MTEIRVGRHSEAKYDRRREGDPYRIHPDDRKDMAFRGYVSAIAARGVKLADLVSAVVTAGDLVEAQRVAGQLLDLVDGPKSSESVERIWERAGCQALLDETMGGWDGYER